MVDKDIDDIVGKTSKDSEEFLEEIKKIVELGEQYDFNFSSSTLFEQVKVLLEHSYNFRRNVSTADNFLTISQMEEMLLDLFKRQKEINLTDFMASISTLKVEKEIIDKKKGIRPKRSET
jgi:hypothetical protein